LRKEQAVKKGRYTEEQIAYALKQAETGTPVAEVIRRMGDRPGRPMKVARWAEKAATSTGRP